MSTSIVEDLSITKTSGSRLSVFDTNQLASEVYKPNGENPVGWRLVT